MTKIVLIIKKSENSSNYGGNGKILINFIRKNIRLEQLYSFHIFKEQIV